MLSIGLILIPVSCAGSNRIFQASMQSQHSTCMFLPLLYVSAFVPSYLKIRKVRLHSAHNIWQRKPFQNSIQAFTTDSTYLPRYLHSEQPLGPPVFNVNVLPLTFSLPPVDQVLLPANNSSLSRILRNTYCDIDITRQKRSKASPANHSTSFYSSRLSWNSFWSNLLSHYSRFIARCSCKAIMPTQWLPGQSV